MSFWFFSQRTITTTDKPSECRRKRAFFGHIILAVDTQWVSVCVCSMRKIDVFHSHASWFRLRPSISLTNTDQSTKIKIHWASTSPPTVRLSTLSLSIEQADQVDSIYRTHNRITSIAWPKVQCSVSLAVPLAAAFSKIYSIYIRVCHGWSIGYMETFD